MAIFLGNCQYLNFEKFTASLFFTCWASPSSWLSFKIHSCLSLYFVTMYDPLIENHSNCKSLEPCLMAQILSKFLLCNSFWPLIVSTFPYLHSFFCQCFWLLCFLHSCLASFLFRYIRCQGQGQVLQPLIIQM